MNLDRYSVTRDKQILAVSTPADCVFSRFDPGKRPRLATADRVKPELSVRINRRKQFAVRRNLVSRCTLRSDWRQFATAAPLDPVSTCKSAFGSLKQEPLPIRQQRRPIVGDGIVRQTLRLSRTGWQ